LAVLVERRAGDAILGLALSKGCYLYSALNFESEIVWMIKIAVAALVILAAASVGQAGGQTEPALSAAESAAVARQIATLHSSVDRSVAGGWRNAKKVAEMICRPAAVAALKKQIPGTDRVFLGTDDPKTLNLESNAKLTGTGSARNPKGWQDFSFTCEVDPATGKVTSFLPVLTATAK
jgi:hypothetical protein